MTLKNRMQKFRSVLRFRAFIVLVILTGLSSCSVQYSMTGVTIDAKTITIIEFYNNADLGPANMGQTLSNDLRNYFIQNTSLSVVQEEGELQLEGEITNFAITPIAPVSTGNPEDLNQASSTRLTITVKATYINSLDDKMSFKDKTFSFYKDFPNDQNIVDVQDQYTKQIFERIINDIFNASVANW
jgi:hypothetical protein